MRSQQVSAEIASMQKKKIDKQQEKEGDTYVPGGLWWVKWRLAQNIVFHDNSYYVLQTQNFNHILFIFVILLLYFIFFVRILHCILA